MSHTFTNSSSFKPARTHAVPPSNHAPLVGTWSRYLLMCTHRWGVNATTHVPCVYILCRGTYTKTITWMWLCTGVNPSHESAPLNTRNAGQGFVMNIVMIDMNKYAFMIILPTSPAASFSFFFFQPPPLSSLLLIFKTPSLPIRVMFSRSMLCLVHTPPGFGWLVILRLKSSILIGCVGWSFAHATTYYLYAHKCMNAHIHHT